MLIIYGISAGFGLVNFFRFREEGGMNRLFYGLITFVLAIVFYTLRWRNIITGNAEFSLFNLFTMHALVLMHVALWLNIFERDFAIFMEKVASFMFLAFVVACTMRLVLIGIV